MKLFIRLGNGFEKLEQQVVEALTAAGGVHMYGQALHGSLERKAINLLGKMGVTLDCALWSPMHW